MCPAIVDIIHIQANVASYASLAIFIFYA